MGVEQVSLDFYPPGWKAHHTPTAMKTVEGEPVQMVRAVPDEEENATPVLFQELANWLVEREFTVVDWGSGRVFQRGQVQSIFGIQQEIIIHIEQQSEQVVSLYCRYTLPKKTKPPIQEWAKFTSEMCQTFGLRVGTKQTQPCGKDELIKEMSGHQNYRMHEAG